MRFSVIYKKSKLKQIKKLIAGSKFADWPGFGTFKKGKIALQDHGDNVWYRNIVIKE